MEYIFGVYTRRVDLYLCIGYLAQTPVFYSVLVSITSVNGPLLTEGNA